MASTPDPPEEPRPSRAESVATAFTQGAMCMRGVAMLLVYGNSSTTVLLVIELLALGLQLAASLTRRR